ncbi:hypothetical protein QBC38DRAFT_518139 [Podospora fimiseda]|uniref:Mid2 domain-containing protein n=1 Tax=Podospora fimiseda TaxID=252190 RepID=A0AAN7BFZ8_9PEZI|nr:hypothetical protein QBC38DRAFT_518139 [Podospora fimiseda]
MDPTKLYNIKPFSSTGNECLSASKTRTADSLFPIRTKPCADSFDLETQWQFVPDESNKNWFFIYNMGFPREKRLDLVLQERPSGGFIVFMGPVGDEYLNQRWGMEEIGGGGMRLRSLGLPGFLFGLVDIEGERGIRGGIMRNESELVSGEAVGWRVLEVEGKMRTTTTSTGPGFVTSFTAGSTVISTTGSEISSSSSPSDRDRDLKIKIGVGVGLGLTVLLLALLGVFLLYRKFGRKGASKEGVNTVSSESFFATPPSYQSSSAGGSSTTVGKIGGDTMPQKAVLLKLPDYYGESKTMTRPGTGSGVGGQRGVKSEWAGRVAPP